jgi:hypothetical protein
MFYDSAPMQLKAYREKNQNLDKSPNLKEGQRINKILKVEFKDTRFRNKEGGMQQVAILTTDSGVFHSTAKAIVDLLHNYFVVEKNAEPMENVSVIESRSADGRNYLELEGF